jgi:hypothetical protein
MYKNQGNRRSSYPVYGIATHSSRRYWGKSNNRALFNLDNCGLNLIDNIFT